MTRTLLRALILLAAAVLLAPFVALARREPVASGPPFVIRVVDQRGDIVPNVYIIADNGLTCRTNANGVTRWPEKSIRRNGVKFSLQSKDVIASDATLDVTDGGFATVVVRRKQ